MAPSAPVSEEQSAEERSENASAEVNASKIVTSGDEERAPLSGERLWATLDLLIGLLLAWLAWRFIPQETKRLAVVPRALIALGGAQALIGLISHCSTHLSPTRSIRRLHWRLNVTLTALASLVGFTLGALCLLSGLYWLGVFGVLGWGVFISALLLLSGVIQLLILYPLLKLRRLLSIEYRSVFKGGGVALLILRVALVSLAISALTGAYTGSISPLPPLTPQARDTVTAYLRATLEGSPITPARDQLGSTGVLTAPLGSAVGSQEESADPLSTLATIPTRGLLYVSFYAGGERLVRVSGRGPNLAHATRDAARALSSHPRLHGRRLRGGRIVVDRSVGSAKIPLTSLPTLGPLILSLSVDPGRDGVLARRRGASKILLASDLVEAERFAVAPIIPGIPELRFGLDAQFISKRLGSFDSMSFERLRTEQWVERVELNSPEEAAEYAAQRASSPSGESTPLTALTHRGHWGARVDLEPVSDPRSTLLARRERYRDAAHLAGQYLIRHQNEDGRFDYQYFPYRDEAHQPSDARYSVPRHAGAVYGLSMLYLDRADKRYAIAARRAIDWLLGYALPECGGWQPEVTCIPKISKRNQIAKLGDSALSALAIFTYLEATGDLELEPLARGLAHFLLRVQRADGDFHHEYLIYDNSVSPHKRGMFASEQAAFALVLAARRWPDGPWRDAAERALDALTIHKYEGDFLSAFFFGADHWTCLATHAATSIIKKPEYLDFCLGYARFLQRLQYRSEAGEGDQTYHGHYGFGFLSPPQAPATGGFTEGVMGALLLAEAYQYPKSELRDLYAQVLASVEALAHDQITDKTRWNIKNFTRAEGAIRRSLVESEVRVDFVQHSLSALLMTQSLAP